MSEHSATIVWENASGAFASGRYSRAHTWTFDGGESVRAAASPFVVPLAFTDPSAVDPEEAFVAAVSSCHMLWFLDLARQAGFVVGRYCDTASGFMEPNADGNPWVARIVLRPEISWEAEVPDDETVSALHDRAHHNCYLANSIRSEVVLDNGTTRAADG